MFYNEIYLNYICYIILRIVRDVFSAVNLCSVKFEV